ncbi:MAG: alpha/beta hydrolase fold domain-containing protein [Candidatus Hydrogenedens sp.]|nr:alpha/beta hydrolase fold domain-containing protein [Candidatus Hydrogenedens sp.]
MNRILKIAGRALLVLLFAAGAAAVWFLYFDGAAPAKRPDLVKLPADAPPPPPGYPTMNMIYLAYLTGNIEMLDPRAEYPVPETVDAERDIEYGTIGDTSLKLDLYRPKEIEGTLPTLIFVHGGGWTQGHRRDYTFYTLHFAERGYAAATISYRFAQEAKYPAALEDTKCAIRWLKANAERLHLDPERFAIIGGSAGGNLSLMAGYTPGVASLEGNGGNPDQSSAVQCVVDLYGPVDLSAPEAREHKTITRFLPQPYADDPDYYRAASPLYRLQAGAPPTFVLQGTIDDLVPVTQSDQLVERLQELGVPHWYARLDGWPHTMDVAPEVNAYVLDLMQRFFEAYL